MLEGEVSACLTVSLSDTLSSTSLSSLSTIDDHVFQVLRPLHGRLADPVITVEGTSNQRSEGSRVSSRKTSCVMRVLVQRVATKSEEDRQQLISDTSSLETASPESSSEDVARRKSTACVRVLRPASCAAAYVNDGSNVFSSRNSF